MEVYRAASTVQGERNLAQVVKPLLDLGFQVVEERSRLVVLRGPGMQSTKHHPLRGASQIALSLSEQGLQADAELGGIEKMKRFLFIFPFGLGMALSLLFVLGGGFLFGRLFDVGFGVPWAPGWKWVAFAGCISLLPVSPWLVLSPLIAVRLRSRTIQAIHRLISSTG